MSNQIINQSVRPKDLETIMSVIIGSKQNLLITGRPGIGKTEIVENACKVAGADLIVSHPVVSDPTDFKGLPFLKDGEAEFLPFNDLKQIINATKLTVFFMDDLGQAPTAVQAAAMQLLQARKLNGHKISDHVVFVGATNRREDKAGVGGFLEPVKSRFTILNLEPTVDDWVDWALNNEDIPLELIGAVRYNPKWVTDWSPSKGIENTPTPRNLAEVAKFMKLGVPDNLRMPLFSGRLGAGCAFELISFLDIFTKLPAIKDIEEQPKRTHVPSAPDQLYALIGALVGHAKKENFDPFCEYIDRLPAEFGVLFMRDIAKRKRELQSCKAYVNWAVKNSNVIL